MGITYIDGSVRNDGSEEDVSFLVDSGATYTLLPERVWKSLELEPTREMELILADGTRVSRGISECWIELPQGRGHTPVILGQPRDDALLGVVTLEEMGLVLNPFERSLQPMRALDLTPSVCGRLSRTATDPKEQPRYFLPTPTYSKPSLSISAGSRAFLPSNT